MLVINAAAFRIPHEIWKVLEGGMMKTFFGKGEVKEKKTKEKKLATLLDSNAQFFESIQAKTQKIKISVITHRAYSVTLNVTFNVSHIEGH